MARISSQIRLAEHAALACVRDCVADLEKTSESISAAGLFQVRQQESKAGEQGMYRKSGECAGLRKAAGQHQAAVSFFGQRGCAVLAGGNALLGELARTRLPPLCPSAHRSPSRVRRDAQDCCGKARLRRRCSCCSWKLPACMGSLLGPQSGSARAAALLGRPSRVAARGAIAGAVVHGVALGRAVARPACPSRSPYTQPLCPGYWAELGTALGRYMHACAAGRVRNVKSRHPPPPRRGPSPMACWSRARSGPAVGGTFSLDFTFWTLPAAHECI